VLEQENSNPQQPPAIVLHSASPTPRFPPPSKTSDTLVFICTYNESGSIGAMLDGLLGLRTRCDVLVVDDNSSDGTLDALAARAASEPRLGVVVRPRKLGIGSAHKLGWLHARRMGYARIATLDADLSHDPADVQRLLDALDAGADVALGSRFVPGAQHGYTGVRLAVSRGANALAAVLLRLPIAEHTTSLRAAKLARVPDGLVETIESDGYGFFVTCVVRLARAGLTFTELPIHFRDRYAGASKISKRQIVYGAANLLRLSVDRRPYAVCSPDVADPKCPVCERPYRMRETSGEVRCLACFGIPEG
jgi:dolichol-phosphate mannosyltransferase